MSIYSTIDWLVNTIIMPDPKHIAADVLSPLVAIVVVFLLLAFVFHWVVIRPEGKA